MRGRRPLPLPTFENAPARRRSPFWALPAVLLAAYLGTVVVDTAGARLQSFQTMPTGVVTEARVASNVPVRRGLFRRVSRAALVQETATASPGVGVASWYGAEFHGLPTASGEPFDMHGLTAAHRTLPLGSRARVTNLANGRSVVVRITDRGPHARRRMIDLSYGAANELAMVPAGSAEVEVVPLAH
jgi:rare lipoprotein A